MEFLVFCLIKKMGCLPVLADPMYLRGGGVWSKKNQSVVSGGGVGHTLSNGMVRTPLPPLATGENGDNHKSGWVIELNASYYLHVQRGNTQGEKTERG